MNTFLQQQQVKNENRRRKTLRKVLKRVQNISLVLVVWLFAIGVIYGLYSLVFERHLFIVKNVEVEGNFSHFAKDDIKELAGIELGSNIFSVKLAEVQKRIMQSDWIKEAAVSRKAPSTVWIYASEWTPFALAVMDDVYLADENGTAFKKASAGEYQNLPVFTGIGDEKELREAMEVLKVFMRSKLADYFSCAEVNADPARGYSIVLFGDGAVLKLGFNGFEEKLDRFYSMLGAIGENKDKIRYVDLNIPGKVVVKYGSQS